MKNYKNKTKKNILIYCPFIERGGIQTSLIKFANFLSNKYNEKIFTEKCEIDILNKLRNKIKIFDSKKARHNKFRIIKDIFIYLNLKKESQKNDIILSIQDHVVPLLLNKLFNRNKIIIRTAGIIPNELNFEEYQHLNNLYLKKFFLRFYKLADKVITFSNENVNYLNLLGVKACCIYNNFERQKKIIL